MNINRTKTGYFSNSLKIFSRAEFLPIAVFLSFVLLTGLALFLSEKISPGFATRFDVFIYNTIRNFVKTEQETVYFFRDITSLGGGTLLTFFFLAAFIYLLTLKRYRSALSIAGISIGGFILNYSLKLLFSRPRPKIFDALAWADSFSFPSGHSAMSMTIYVCLAIVLTRNKNLLVKLFALILALIISFVVGLSRVYLGVHYPTDVLAGWTVGLLLTSIFWFFYNRAELNEAV